MNWTKTPPTEPGWYYWRYSESEPRWTLQYVYKTGDVEDGDDFVPADKLYGFWGGKVPEPGTTFSVEMIQRVCCVLYDRNATLKEIRDCVKVIIDDENIHGIAATTQCNKEKRT